MEDPTNLSKACLLNQTKPNKSTHRDRRPGASSCSCAMRMFGCFSNVIFSPPPAPPQLGSSSIMLDAPPPPLGADCSTLTDVLHALRSLDTAAMCASVELLDDGCCCCAASRLLDIGVSATVGCRLL